MPYNTANDDPPFIDFLDFAEPDYIQADESPPYGQFTEELAFNFAIIGIGESGNSIAAMFHEIGYRRILLIDAAEADFDFIQLDVAKLALGTQGTANNNLENWQELTDEDTTATRIRASIARILKGRVDKIIVCYDLGGGIGLFGGPKVIQIAKEMVEDHYGSESDVIAFATFPDPVFNDPKQCSIVLEAYNRLNDLKVPTLTIDKAKIRKGINEKSNGSGQQTYYQIVETFHQFNVYAAKASQDCFSEGDFHNTLRGRFIFTEFHIPQFFDNNGKCDIHNTSVTMIESLGNSPFVKAKLSTANVAACLFILNEPVFHDKPVGILDPPLVELNRIMQPASTLHRGIYLEEFPPLKNGSSPPDMLCCVMLGGLDIPEVALAQLRDKAKNSSTWHDSIAELPSSVNPTNLEFISQSFQDRPSANNDLPVVHSAASGKGNKPIIPLELYGEEATIEPAGDPVEFVLKNHQDIVDPIVEVVRNLEQSLSNFTTYRIPGESRDARWHRESRDSYNGKGWTEIAEQEGATGKTEIKRKADEIRQAVGRYRKENPEK